MFVSTVDRTNVDVANHFRARVHEAVMMGQQFLRRLISEEELLADLAGLLYPEKSPEKIKADFLRDLRNFIRRKVRYGHQLAANEVEVFVGLAEAWEVPLDRKLAVGLEEVESWRRYVKRGPSDE